jgi:DNA replication initiation complex subunit (GINS family)
MASSKDSSEVSTSNIIKTT